MAPRPLTLTEHELDLVQSLLQAEWDRVFRGESQGTFLPLQQLDRLRTSFGKVNEAMISPPAETVAQKIVNRIDRCAIGFLVDQIGQMKAGESLLFPLDPSLPEASSQPRLSVSQADRASYILTEIIRGPHGEETPFVMRRNDPNSAADFVRGWRQARSTELAMTAVSYAQEIREAFDQGPGEPISFDLAHGAVGTVSRIVGSLIVRIDHQAAPPQSHSVATLADAGTMLSRETHWPTGFSGTISTEPSKELQDYLARASAQAQPRGASRKTTPGQKELPLGNLTALRPKKSLIGVPDEAEVKATPSESPEEALAYYRYNLEATPTIRFSVDIPATSPEDAQKAFDAKLPSDWFVGGLKEAIRKESEHLEIELRSQRAVLVTSAQPAKTEKEPEIRDPNVRDTENAAPGQGASRRSSEDDRQFDQRTRRVMTQAKTDYLRACRAGNYIHFALKQLEGQSLDATSDFNDDGWSVMVSAVVEIDEGPLPCESVTVCFLASSTDPLARLIATSDPPRLLWMIEMASSPKGMKPHDGGFAFSHLTDDDWMPATMAQAVTHLVHVIRSLQKHRDLDDPKNQSYEASQIPTQPPMTMITVEEGPIEFPEIPEDEETEFRT